MGACDSCNSGRQFPTSQVGIRAQIQHLKNFADAGSRAILLAHPPVVEWYGRRSNGVLDPALAIYNFDTFFAKGTAPTWNQMGGPGKWASDSMRRASVRYRSAWQVAPSPAGTPATGSARLPAGNYPYWPGWDVGRSLAGTPDGRGLVILDGYGGVWPTGTVAHLPTDYFGFDIGRDIVVTPAGDGYAVLDGFGGIHRSGNVPATQDVGYAPFDRWRGPVIRNGRYTVVRNDAYRVT